MEEKKIIDAKRAYYKRWREKHPENVKRARATFWERRALELEKEAGETEQEQGTGEA